MTGIERLQQLRSVEETLRAQARRLELDPGKRLEAEVLFRRASGVRRLRLALLDRWQLL